MNKFRISILKRCNKRYYSFSIQENEVKNPLGLEDGAYGLTSNIKMPTGLKWEKSDLDRKSIGCLGGNGGMLDHEYFAEVAKKFGIELSDNKGFDTLEHMFKIGAISEEKANAEKLAEIFKTFNPLVSYSLGFVVYLSKEHSFKTIGGHYLVNNTTNAYDLIKDFYRKLDDVRIRYSFLARDRLIIKFWALQIKVKDPKFSKSNINPSVIKTITNNNLPMFKNKFLSSNFIPLSMQFHIYYGILLSKDGNIFKFIYNNRTIKVEVIDFMNEHIVTIYESDGEFIARVLDVRWNQGFIRCILNKEDNIEPWSENQLDKTTFLYIEKFKLENLEYKVNTRFLTPIAKEYIHKDKFITMDIESYRENNCHIPYACGFYDGKKVKLYYSTNFKDWREMINVMIDDIMIPKYAGYRVYAHNFNKFDSAFLFRIIQAKHKVSNVLPRNTGLLSFTATAYNAKSKKSFNLKFCDSIALLPFSLAYLGESFKVDVCKDVFPYDFVNASNLHYIGALPDYKYFPQSLDMLIKYTNMVNWYNNNWDMKSETLNYLTKDLISLYQVILEMDKIIFNNYRINITNKPTIASLSMAILRSNFMNKTSHFPKTNGSVENAVRSAYFGGRNELFRPVEYGVYGYDFNSLYPTAMLEDLPVGNAVFSLTKDINKIFGFIKVKVTSPDNIKIPVLPVKLPTKSGDVKLVFPCGSWTGWYFSEEVKLALKYGYKVEVLESYIFERGKGVLKNYVEHMASYKDNSTGAIRNIHKLLLNTPYGRLGMKNIRDVVKIVTNKEYEEIIKRYNVIDVFRLSDTQLFIKHSKHPSKMACEQSGIKYEEEIMKAIDNDFVDNSTPIAAAIASWARIIMYPWILNSAYTDTDSIFLKSKLPSNMIGKGLGKFKEEHGGQIYKAIFISPKLYYLSTVRGEITKSKGISRELSKFDFNILLNDGSLDIEEERWVRNLKDENVTILNQKIKISGDYDKRNKIFSKGKWVDTSPLIINHLFEIISTDIIIYENKYLIKYQPTSVKLSLRATQAKGGVADNAVIVYHRPVTSIVPALFKAKNLIIYQTPCLDLMYREVRLPRFATVKTIPHVNFNSCATIHEFERKVLNSIHESNMLAANAVIMSIYRLTGIFYDGNMGAMYYIDKSSKSNVYIRKSRR